MEEGSDFSELNRNIKEGDRLIQFSTRKSFQIEVSKDAQATLLETSKSKLNNYFEEIL